MKSKFIVFVRRPDGITMPAHFRRQGDVTTFIKSCSPYKKHGWTWQILARFP